MTSRPPLGTNIAGVILVSSACAVACSSAASSDPGLDALMQVTNAQFVPGEPTKPGKGPKVESLELLTNTVWPGYFNKPIRGTLGSDATAVNVMLSGDRGYWILLAQPPDVAAPDLPTFRATAAFAETLPQHEYSLLLQAVNSRGHSGPIFEHALTFHGRADRNVAQADLVVDLTWSTDADLDLHVIDPQGTEIFHGQKTSYDGFAPNASAEAGSPGVLAFDSNADCDIDGQRREVITWAQTPPPGEYLVKVDTKSLCAEAIAHFEVDVMRGGNRIAYTSGVSVDADTWGSHDRGAGVLALHFSVP